MNNKIYRFLSVVFAAAIALSITTHVYSVPESTAYPTLSFPIAEPTYNSKRPRDLSPFNKALANFTPQRRSQLDRQLLEANVPKMQELMASRKLSATELVTYYLDRIQRYDINKLNSVMELNPDALAIAQKLDNERKSGKVRSPMHGIPVLLKDNIATGDKMHTTAGAYVLKDWRADRDATLVKQLRASGAIVLGKANLSEWANFLDPKMPNGFSGLGGQTRNPYGAFDTLGSSSGSAVAVGANLVAVSVGSETQGSIVQPAAKNNVVGLKPSYGMVSGDYVIPLVSWADVPGPMGRTVTDVATLLNAIAATVADAKPDFTKFLSLDAARKRRVGVFTYDKAFIDATLKKAIASQGGNQPTPSELAEATKIFTKTFEAQNRRTQSAIAALRSQKIEVVEINATKLPEDNPSLIISPTDLKDNFKVDINRFLAVAKGIPVNTLAKIIEINKADPTNRIPYGQGYLEESQNSNITATDLATRQTSLKQAATDRLNQLFDSNNVSVIVMPSETMFAHAPSGFPALTVPGSYSPTGEPQGIKFVGRYLGDADVIAVGYAYEQKTQIRKAPDLDATIATFKNLKQAIPSKL
jgi:amidase